MSFASRRLACVLALASLTAACASSEGTLIIQVRTDLLPGSDFALVHTTATAEGSGVLTVPDVSGDSVRTWGTGVRVAELPNLGPGEYRVQVQVLDARGEVVTERPVRVELDGSVRVVTVLLTRDCQGVVCSDASASACLAGRCVPDECHEEGALACGGAECTEDGECPGTGCAMGECTSGVCFTSLQHQSCPDDQLCDASSGMCMGDTPPPMTCSSPAFSSGCGDQAIIRALVTLGPGMGSMTGTVRVTQAHTAIGDLSTGGVFHTEGAGTDIISETQAMEIHLDHCAGGEMWSEENGGYNLWAYLDLNENVTLDAGEPAGNVEFELSCHETVAPCHSIVLDCTAGMSCVIPTATPCDCDPASCDRVGGPSRSRLCGC